MANIGQQGAKLDIIITKGATYSLPFSTSDIGDFTLKTWSVAIRYAADNDVIVTGAVNVLSATTATIDFTATQTGTLTVGSKYEWTCKYTLGSTVLPLFQGNAVVIEL